MEFATMSFCDVHVFDFDTVDGIDGHFQYNNVVFRLESLDQYDGTCVEVLEDWKVIVWGEAGKQLKEFYIMENEEFRQRLYEKYPLKG